MTVRSRVHYVGSPELLGKAFRLVLKDALQETGRDWHETMLPRHFGRGAASRYGYARRAQFYAIKKRRIRRHGRPLEFYGDLKREVLQRRTISGTGKTARVKIRGPRYLYAFRKDLRQPDKAAELTATNRADRDALARFLERTATEKLNRIKAQETVRTTA